MDFIYVIGIKFMNVSIQIHIIALMKNYSNYQLHYLDHYPFQFQDWFQVQKVIIQKCNLQTNTSSTKK